MRARERQSAGNHTANAITLQLRNGQDSKLNSWTRGDLSFDGRLLILHSIMSGRNYLAAEIRRRWASLFPVTEAGWIGRVLWGCAVRGITIRFHSQLKWFSRRPRPGRAVYESIHEVSGVVDALSENNTRLSQFKKRFLFSFFHKIVKLCSHFVGQFYVAANNPVKIFLSGNLSSIAAIDRYYFLRADTQNQHKKQYTFWITSALYT